MGFAGTLSRCQEFVESHEISVNVLLHVHVGQEEPVREELQEIRDELWRERVRYLRPEVEVGKVGEVFNRLLHTQVQIFSARGSSLISK